MVEVFAMLLAGLLKMVENYRLGVDFSLIDL